MNKTVSVRKWGKNYSLSIPVEFKVVFEDTNYAIVEKKGDSLIYRPAEIRAKGVSSSELDEQI